MSREECLEHLRLADEKLAAARHLATEGFSRDAAGRAYYAMYHAAFALVRSKGHAPKTHRGLLALLAQEFVKPGVLQRSDFVAITKAQQLREWSDYEIGTPPTEEAAAQAIADAEAFIGRVRPIVG